jgi:hypothetical protein
MPASGPKKDHKALALKHKSKAQALALNHEALKH